jgi:hypothetical protein
VSALPTRFAPVIVAFAGLFRQRTWRHARALLIGAILAPGVRTVTSVLRVLGLACEHRWVNYHRVLSRAVWSPRAASYLLLRLLVCAFAPTGPLVLGIDETIERRRGKCIRAKGIYRDPVRSSQSHFVKASGLRWIAVMLLAPIPWAGRVWALPFLTALAPSERANREAGRRRKLLTDWARQLLRQTQRWCAMLAPGRPVIMVGDMSYAALELLGALSPQMTCITRLRLDARLFTPAPPRQPHTTGRPRVKGERLPLLSAVLVDPATRWQRVTIPGWYGEGARDVELASGTAVWHHPGMPVVPLRWVLVRDPFGCSDPQALLCTDVHLTATEVVGYYVRRWRVEVTFEETRRHKGGGNPTAMVRPRHRPHHAHSPWPLFARHAPRDAARARGATARPHGGVVRQAHADLQRRVSRGPAPLVAHDDDFLHLGTRGGHDQTAPPNRPTTQRGSLLRRLKRPNSRLVSRPGSSDHDSAPSSRPVANRRRHRGQCRPLKPMTGTQHQNPA